MLEEARVLWERETELMCRVSLSCGVWLIYRMNLSCGVCMCMHACMHVGVCMRACITG